MSLKTIKERLEAYTKEGGDCEFHNVESVDGADKCPSCVFHHHAAQDIKDLLAIAEKADAVVEESLDNPVACPDGCDCNLCELNRAVTAVKYKA